MRKLNNRGNNKGNNRGNNQGQSINLNEAYNKLKSLYAERIRLEKTKKNVWAQIQRYGCNKDSEVQSLGYKIGNATHKINLILNQLSKCHKAHKVMNFAYNYICSEVTRLERIEKKWDYIVDQVDSGYMELRDSEGNISSDSTSSKNYLGKKRHQLEQLRKWKAQVAKYRV